MIALSDFVFELRTVPYPTLERTTEQRWASTQPIGEAPRHQYIGPGEESITLAGVLYPEITGSDMQQLRELAASGQSHIIVDGQGYYLGNYLIDKISETHSMFFKDGTARKIEFTLSLKKESHDSVQAQT